MGKYLKLFNEDVEYQQFKESEGYILPNVSFVENDNVVYYNPFVEEKPSIIMARYNATEDNLVAFNGATNIKSMKVNGTPIKIEPIKNDINTFDVLGENISLDMETGAATFPDSYLIKSPVTSLSLKAKDINYTINENTYVCMMGMMSGMTMVEPMPLKETMGYVFTTNDGVTLEVVDTFLDELNMQIQYGLQMGFILMDMDMNSGTFVFIDTERQTNVTTGGLPTYTFDSEGLYDVEIELSDPAMSMQFTETPLISIEIGDGITSIGDEAFAVCSGLTGELVIPDSVTYIGSGSFRYCSNLTSVTIGDSVTSIGSMAFSNCSSLNEIICKGNIAPQIQNDTFGNYYNQIKKFGVLAVPDNADYSAWMSTDNYYLGYYGWTCSNIPVYDLICTYNVNDISMLTKLYSDTYFEPYMMIINDEKLDASTYHKFNEIGYHEVIYRFLTPITEIGENTFRSCTNLTSVVISDSVTSIGNSAFYDCSGLTSVVISDSVTSIGNYAFQNCDNLTSVHIGSGVTDIGAYAFAYCNNLTGELIIPDSVTMIQYRAFFGNSSLTSIVVSSGNTVYDSRENCNCLIETATNALIKGCNNSFIPDSVTSIGEGTFNGCSGLTEVHIGSGVTFIGDYAFSDCSGLTGELIIPDSVTSIGNYAFQNCDNLTSVHIGSGVTDIGNSAFYLCEGLTGELIIPDSVTSIGANAFQNCNNLTSVVIGSGVTDMGFNIFSWCSSLNEIICLAPTAPTIANYAFYGVTYGGVLRVPTGSDYSAWMSTSNYYLGYYNWTVEYI